MVILRRLIVLGLFTAIGVGLALVVALSTSSPGAGGAANSPELAADVTPPGSQDAPLPDVNSLTSSRQTSSRGSPPGPIVVAPLPARASQVLAARPSDGPLKALRLWKHLAAGLLAQVGGDSDASTPEPVPLPLPVQGPTGDVPSRPAGDQAPGTRIVPGEGDDQLEIDVQNEDIRVVLEALSKQGDLNILACASVQGTVSATLKGVDIESALDAILKSTGYVARREGKFIFVGTPQDFEAAEQSLETIGTRVYRPNYVTAAELQQLIQPLLTEGIGVASVSSPAEVGIQPDATNAGGDAFAAGDVLVIRDYLSILDQVDQVVAEIDTRPMQVAIEAMILSVALDDGNELGVSFELLRNKEHIRLGWGTPADSLLWPSFEFDQGGLKFGFLDSSLGAFIHALETIGDTNVIATPRVMVLNKHRAEILIGEELGYVNMTATETATMQNVEFLKVGAQLSLRPFVSSDGLIRMEVHPELSTGSVRVEKDFTLPNKETTQVTSNIMVRDGCTVVIGGLMREELETTASQVPLLGSLPIVGPAFRTVSETLERREILVLITPRIVYEPDTCQEGRQEACEYLRRQAVYREKMSPLGKRHLGRKYLRLAQNAWAAGRRDTALRFAEMSIHFDPTNREAIDLRSNVWLGLPGIGAPGGPPPGAPVTAPMDGTVIAPWVLDDLERQPPRLPGTLHPLDPGRPGRHLDVEPSRSLP